MAANKSGTRIHLAGSDKSLSVDEPIADVGRRLGSARGFEQLTRRGQPVWVNPANVLYAEEDRPGKVVAF